jgi:Lipase (class 3)
MITGHSLGGALAIVAASRLKAEHSTSKVDTSVYTFGQPKLALDDFRKSFNEKVTPEGVYQVVNHSDIVPRALFWYTKLETTRYIKGRETPILDRMTSKQAALDQAIAHAKLSAAQATNVRNAVARLDVLSCLKA